MTKESLQLLVQQAQSYVSRQWDAFESQDRKIAGLFTLSSGLITLVPTVLSNLGADNIDLRLIPFALASGAYVIAIPLHWLAYHPSEIYVAGNAAVYTQGWMELSEEDVLRLTLFDLAELQAKNDVKLLEKQRSLTRAAAAVAFEIVFLIAGILSVVA
jgi:hypothetical protein